jgi:hypothetical protein
MVYPSSVDLAASGHHEPHTHANAIQRAVCLCTWLRIEMGLYQQHALTFSRRLSTKGSIGYFGRFYGLLATQQIGN